MNRELAKALALLTTKSGYADLGAEPVALNTTEFKMLLPNEGKLLSTRIKEQKTSSTDGCWRPAIAPKYYFFIATSAL